MAGGGDQKSGKELMPDPIEDPGQARDKAATAVGVNPRYVSDAKAIHAAATSSAGRDACLRFFSIW